MTTAPADDRRRWIRGALVALGVVVAVACLALAVVVLVRDGEDAEVAEPGTTSVPAAPVGPFVAPLTGLVADDPAARTRPALVVKIDNSDVAARPQSGVNQADVVYEEKVEGPLSRFAAVFQSEGADTVGPVRSGRSTDVAIVGPLNHPLYAFSGANPTFLALLRRAPLVDVGYDAHPEAYLRVTDRRVPDNLFSSTSALWALTPAGAVPPAALFAYSSAGDSSGAALGGAPASFVGYTFGTGVGSAPVRFDWDEASGSWRRTQGGTSHIDADGRQIAVSNVIVQLVPYVDTGITDVAGTPVPEADLVGSGEAIVALDGWVVRGRWAKDAPTSPTRFTSADGTTIALSPGRTWVALVPVGQRVDVG